VSGFVCDASMDTKFKSQLQQLDRIAESAKPVLKKVGEFIDFVGPYAVICYNKLLELWKQAEQYKSEMKIALGFFFLFFGGNVVYTLVAFEAFMVIGFDRTKRSLITLYESFTMARDVLAKDDLDSSQPEPPQRHEPVSTPTFLKQTEKITQKISNLAKKLDPEKVTQSLADLSTGMIAAIAALQSSLARCITIGASLSDLILKHHKEAVISYASRALPMEFQKWIEPGFRYGSKVIGFIVAFLIQKWLLVYSACLRGTDLLLSGLHDRHLISDEQFSILCKISAVVASVGFLKQLFYGSTMWAILQVVLFPVFIVEYLLKIITAVA